MPTVIGEGCETKEEMGKKVRWAVRMSTIYSIIYLTTS